MAQKEEQHYKSARNKSLSSDGYENIKYPISKLIQEIKERKERISLSSSQVELYKQARDFEKESEKFYREEASKVKDKSTKKILLEFAEEEKEHFEIMDELVEYIDRPTHWVENAEFSHQEAY